MRLHRPTSFALAAVAAGAALLPSDASAATAHVVTRTPSVIDSLTTQTSQVVDNHNGTYTLRTYREPVRAKTAGGWRSLNLNLTLDRTGRVRPDVAANPVTFSGGGNTTAATFGNGAQRISYIAQFTLPKPRLAGPTATYPNVYPGVDLALTATATGFSTVLIVKTRAAASNPKLRTQRWTVLSAGARPIAQEGGAVTVRTEQGEVSTAAPVMWDSRRGAFGPTAKVTDSGTGDITSIPALSVMSKSSAQVTMTVPARKLTGTGVTYPVYIDPMVSMSRTHTLTVSSSGARAYDSTTRRMQVGRCGWTDCGSVGTARSFFSLSLTGLVGSRPVKIVSADVGVEQVWSAARFATPVDLRGAGSFTSATGWPGPATTAPLASVSSNAGLGGSRPGYLHFGGSTIQNYLQTAINNGANTASFALQSPNEANVYQWKQFGTNPYAAITYAATPAVPTNVAPHTTVACPGKPIYATSAEPQVTATATSFPGDNTLGVDFSVFRKNPTDANPVLFKQTLAPVTATSGSPTYWNGATEGNTTNTASLTDGTWQVRARSVSSEGSATLTSAWSSPSTFVVDTTPPPTPTIVRNPNGTLTFTSAGASGFVWSTGGLPTLTNTTCNYDGPGMARATGGTATVTPDPGPNVYRVQAFDDAHNTSDTAVLD